MTIGFILNGEDVVVNSEADVRLIDILRGSFGLLGSKTGCLTGFCGVCTVFFNGQLAPACLIPAFRVRGSEIVTIEGFSQTDEYQDIITGFSMANIGNCGYCLSGKILSASALLEQTPHPTKEEILFGFSGIKCRCISSENLVEAINIIADIRQRRLYGRTA